MAELHIFVLERGKPKMNFDEAKFARCLVPIGNAPLSTPE
jgi:hypothetical protein|tara:strand:+ start:1394 stop:1513 length:120 start_codon:yes stop_codon:yes gene_type:complete